MEESLSALSPKSMCAVNIDTVTSRTQGEMANLSLLFHVWLLTVYTNTVHRIILPSGCLAWPVRCVDADNVCRKCPPQLSPSWMFTAWRLLLLRSAEPASSIQLCTMSPAPSSAVFNNPAPCWAAFNNPASLFSAIKWTLCASWMLSFLQWWAHNHPIQALCP